MWWWLVLTGCVSTDEELIEALEGTWSGSAQVEGQARSITATLQYAGYLSGDLSIEESAGLVSYGVRRADAYHGAVGLDLQQSGGVQFLSLDGTLEGASFAGDATMTWDCGEPQPCGYSGTFALTSTGGPVDTGP